MFMIMMLFAVIAIIAIVLFLPRLVQKNSIVINTENGIVRNCELPFLVPKSNLLVIFSQLQSKFVGMKQIVSKKSKNICVRFKLGLRNNLNEVAYRFNFLGNGRRRDGPFLRKFRGSYSRC